MQKALLFFLALFYFFACYSQRIQTIVPDKPVVVGNAFQVQYIVPDPSGLIKITPPSFENLRLVSGPNYYKGRLSVGGKIEVIENITYTVVPLKTGKIGIKGIVAIFKNGEEKSNDVTIDVMPQPKASFNSISSYTDLNLYAPSSKSDLKKLVDENLFIRAEVDRKVCFLGEAIVATFKLYSRLQSVSEVINAPSLYGFSVMDILNIDEAHQSVENIGGKVYNTSVLRKLQLYPGQTGKLVIDEMQLKNEVQFKDSWSGKKIHIEKLLASNPIEITVKEFPGNPPTGYSGAVGKFTITAKLQSQKIGTDQQGRLIVSLKGKGNFIQFGEPHVGWPNGCDAFEAEVSDHLDKNLVPVHGSREYVFAFTAGAGSYRLEPISFSYFDPSTKTYQTIQSDPLPLEVFAVAKKEIRTIEERVPNTSKTGRMVLIVFLVIVSALYLLFRSKKKPALPVSTNSPALPGYHHRLEQISVSALPGKQTCIAIQKLLAEIERDQTLSPEQKQELQSIQNDCHLIIYTQLNAEGAADEVKRRTMELIKQLT